jgi:Concanavalin A-like lectin/glucanases superfamily
MRRLRLCGRLPIAAAGILAVCALGATAGRSAFSSVATGATGHFATKALFQPKNVAPPLITGTVQEDQQLQATTGDWDPGRPASTYVWQWSRCSGSGVACTDISGATSQTYTATSVDVDRTLRVTVIASNSGGTADPVTSAATGGVSPAPPVNTIAPTITGTTTTGETLSASAGAWTANPTAFSYAWLRCDSTATTTCSAIAGAASSRYTLDDGDARSRIRVKVTATNPGGSASALSAPTPTVSPPAPTNTAPPSVSGPARTYWSEVADAGTWTRDASTTVQWRRCDASGDSCSAIDGATAVRYRTTAADTGMTLRATVTATSPAGATATATSSKSPVIAAAANVTTGPLLDSAAKGHTLTFANLTLNVEGALGGDSAAMWRSATGSYAQRLTPEPDLNPGAGSMTIETWIRLDPDSTGGTVVERDACGWSKCALGASDGSPSSMYQLSVTTSGAVIWHVRSADNVATTLTAPGDFRDGAWHLVDAVLDRSPSEMRLAVDGRVIAIQPDSVGTVDTDQAPFMLGAGCTAGTKCTPASVLDGDIDDTSVYHSALNAARVVAHWEARTTPSDFSDAVMADQPVAYWKIDEPHQAPINTTAPAISGPLVSGRTASAVAGAWSGSPSLTYRWQVQDSSSGSWTDIGGATGTTYTPTSVNIGRRLRFVVTATSPGGSASAGSEAVAVTSGYEQAVLDDKPVAYYRMNETSGSTLVARVGANGAYAGGLTLGATSQGALGSGVLFSTTGSATLPTPSGIDGRSDTIEMVVDVVGNGSGAFVSAGNQTNAGYVVGMGGSTFSDSSPTGQPQLLLLYEGSRWIPTGTFLNRGWHHIVVELGPTGDPLVYVDNAGRYSDAGGAPLALGAITAVAGRGFQGRIDEVAFYDKQLSNAQIAGHFAAEN